MVDVIHCNPLSDPGGYTRIDFSIEAYLYFCEGVLSGGKD